MAYFSELLHLKLRSRVRSPQAVEDLRQETFARVLTALRGGGSGIREAERLGAFVNSVCNNVLLEHYRASSRDSSAEGEDAASEVTDNAPDVLSLIAHKQTEEKVRQILGAMPERDRRLLKEVFLEERDKDEVCKDFGVERDYLRVLLHRAKQAFKSMYLKNVAAGAGGAPGRS